MNAVSWCDGMHRPVFSPVHVLGMHGAACAAKLQFILVGLLLRLPGVAYPWAFVVAYGGVIGTAPGGITHGKSFLGSPSSLQIERLQLAVFLVLKCYRSWVSTFLCLVRRTLCLLVCW